jgi:ABC transport system ATP-binding/permease protein
LLFSSYWQWATLAYGLLDRPVWIHPNLARQARDHTLAVRLRWNHFRVDENGVSRELGTTGALARQFPAILESKSSRKPYELPPILNAQNISKSYGAAPLFRNVAFTISEADRIGVIGPNGSGKSTLLQILSGTTSPDSGEVALRKRVRLSFVHQESQFAGDQTVRSVIAAALERSGVPPDEWQARLAATLGRAGLEDLDAPTESLSGGWRKRLAIAEALVQQPDVLLLDEPTNHLDLAAIEWLEELLQSASFASVVVSHDRYFLENVATTMVELNRTYPDGLLRVTGNYSKLLEEKEAFLRAQAKHQEALENRVHREIEWLRRGPKARTSKSKARIDKANQLIGDLADLNARTRTASAAIDFSATDRKTRRLMELHGLSFEVGGRTLFRDLDFILTPGTRVGLVGANGSGKTTLLRLLSRELPPASGEIRTAEALQIVYFDQNRVLDSDVTLRRALAPDSDSVIYQDRVIHVASWAARFLFTGEQLNQPVGRLSGGERARVLLAKLMLQPADVLLLDEPTNDLDIPTLEVLEESLMEFRGALVLVTHDRYLLDRVSTTVLGLDGEGSVGRFADYSQWERWLEERQRVSKEAVKTADRQTAAAFSAAAATTAKKKLSYLEAREYATLEQRISEAEKQVEAARSAFEDPSIASDAARLLAMQAQLERAQEVVDQLYDRWEELETRMR